MFIFKKTVLTGLAVTLLIFHHISDEAYSFNSSEEYLSHAGGSASCVTVQCHAGLAKEAAKNLHEPVSTGKCSVCHKAEAYPNKYGVETDQRIVCALCHKQVDNEVRSSEFVHGPIKEGDCISCHDPHKSNEVFLLRQPFNKMCLTCHKANRLYKGNIVHKPVKDGNCGLCHDPHASNYKYRLTDVGTNLCITCHSEMVEGMAFDSIHAPLLGKGCTDCHDAHAGNDKLRLKAPKEKICLTCHEEKKKEIEQYTIKHKPAFEGKCISCHSPHFSRFQFLLRDKVDNLCFECHKENRVWMDRRFKHGPVVQGNCSSCHNPHGSYNAFILKLFFPHKFYSEYEKGKYDLCFLCHKEAMVTTEKTEKVTYFRNGDINLHKLHVNQKKGRTCRACTRKDTSEKSSGSARLIFLSFIIKPRQEDGVFLGATKSGDMTG
jgi:predicted CXXCH cytochrome family protein